MKNDQLAIITISLHKENITDLIESLKRQKNSSFHLFIIDVTDQTWGVPSFVTVIKEKNKGYAYGINRGIQHAKKQGYAMYCVINDDTYMEPDFVDSALHSLEQQPNSLVGGKIYYAPGYEYHADRYQKKDLGNVLWYAGGVVDWAHAVTKHRGVDEIDRGQYDSFEKTGFITGCLILLDAYTIDSLGYMDESYFLYYEDADYCERAKQKNITLFYDPSVRIWHKISRSTGGSGSKLQAKYQKKNQLKWAMKYGPLRTKLHLIKNYFIK